MIVIYERIRVASASLDGSRSNLWILRPDGSEWLLMTDKTEHVQSAAREVRMAIREAIREVLTGVQRAHSHPSEAESESPPARNPSA